MSSRDKLRTTPHWFVRHQDAKPPLFLSPSFAATVSSSSAILLRHKFFGSFLGSDRPALPLTELTKRPQLPEVITFQPQLPMPT
jgi:hypothetical protein